MPRQYNCWGAGAGREGTEIETEMETDLEW